MEQSDMRTGTLESYALFDCNEGRVVSGYQCDTPYSPASLTKVATAYVVASWARAGGLDYSHEVRSPIEACGAAGVTMFADPDHAVPIQELLQGVLVASANDAAQILAHVVGGSELTFVAMMNEAARAMGLTSTALANCTGLPARGHYSTAAELARLANRFICDCADTYRICGQAEFRFGGNRFKNRNSLIGLNVGVDGVKTGYTDEAGYNLIASAVREGKRRIAVVLGASDEVERDKAALALLDLAVANPAPE